MIEYFRVYVLDYIKFMPRYRKLLWIALVLFGIVVFAPITQELIIPFGIVAIVGFFVLFWAAIVFSAEQFKLWKNKA
jgi:hypothetical protein